MMYDCATPHVHRLEHCFCFCPPSLSSFYLYIFFVVFNFLQAVFEPGTKILSNAVEICRFIIYETAVPAVTHSHFVFMDSSLFQFNAHVYK